MISSRRSCPASEGLLTTPLTGPSGWPAGLAALLPVVVETSKWLRRRHAAEPTPVDAQRALAPNRAVTEGMP